MEKIFLAKVLTVMVAFFVVIAGLTTAFVVGSSMVVKAASGDYTETWTVTEMAYYTKDGATCVGSSSSVACTGLIYGMPANHTPAVIAVTGQSQAGVIAITDGNFPTKWTVTGHVTP